MTNEEKRSLALSAYYDGELSRFGRWRVERMLRNSADLRRELAELENLSAEVRTIESQPATSERRDHWSEIGPALYAIDREVDGRSGRGAARKWGADSEGMASRAPAGVFWGSLAAGGAVAVLVLALVVDNQSAISEDPALDPYGGVVRGSLRYLQTNGVSYVVSQDTEDVTIIWLMDADGVAEGA